MTLPLSGRQGAWGVEAADGGLSTRGACWEERGKDTYKLLPPISATCSTQRLISSTIIDRLGTRVNHA